MGSRKLYIELVEKQGFARKMVLKLQQGLICNSYYDTREYIVSHALGITQGSKKRLLCLELVQLVRLHGVDFYKFC